MPGLRAQVGDVLGRIHAATADDPQVARRFATDANFHAIRLEPYLVEASRMHPDAADRLLAAVDRTASTRRVLVHGDVSPKNVLVGGGRPVLLDAECAWFGDPAFDLAFCLNHFLLKAAHRPAGSNALLACFDGFVAAYLPHVPGSPSTRCRAGRRPSCPGWRSRGSTASRRSNTSRAAPARGARSIAAPAELASPHPRQAGPALGQDCTA
jgi:hypothetical protein